MNTLLIILTLLEGGQLSAAFANTDSPQACAHRAVMVRGVLEATGAPIEQIVCRAASSVFSPFQHAAIPDATRYHYDIRFDRQHADITQLAPEQPCPHTRAANDMDKVARYCAMSTQSLLATDHRNSTQP